MLVLIQVLTWPAILLVSAIVAVRSVVAALVVADAAGFVARELAGRACCQKRTFYRTNRTHSIGLASDHRNK